MYLISSKSDIPFGAEIERINESICVKHEKVTNYGKPQKFIYYTVYPVANVIYLLVAIAYPKLSLLGKANFRILLWILE